MKFLKILLFGFTSVAYANPFLFNHPSSETTLKVEVLKDRSLHFELLNFRPLPDRIWTSPMVLQNPELDHEAGLEGNVIRNKDFIVSVNPENLCVTVKDLNQNWDFVTTCPHNIQNPWKGLAVFTNDQLNAYGLGAYYQNPGTADGDWVGRVWDPGAHTEGNALRGFSAGAQSYAMFPVLYVQGSGLRNYMMFYDSVYKQMWSMDSHPWRIESYGDQVRWYIFTESNVKKLRQKFMNFVGHATVPPKAAFGMWLSEFGYENWGEVYEEVHSMHNAGMPVDGVALDLQWFGGSFYQGDVDRSGSRFGTLAFDEHNFPNPKNTIAHLREQMGVEVMTIEESYISQWLEEFRLLEQHGFMARNCDTFGPAILTSNPWWGIGGMIDWTNPDAGLYWHNLKRQKLYELGITYHWTDLGEPEMYDPNSCYYGFHTLGKHRHSDVHNIYNFKWLESIARGYEFNNNEKRPFSMSRSGTVGIARFGAAMWSGDIGANMGALTAHYQAQMHMSYSGIDYFGSDIGGFHRRPDTLDGDPNELYTQWFANAVLFDFPVRAHTWNLSNGLETAPSKIGDFNSNKFNLKLRYKLIPYLYSLAHQAYIDGSPVIIPMPMEFPTDQNLRKIGNQKMVGPFLMGAMSAAYGEKSRGVYLPAGKWIDFHTGAFYSSVGESFESIPTVQDGIFRLPLFIREGAIVPMLKDYDGRSNINGRMMDGSYNRDVELVVFPAEFESNFALSEDDGVSVHYRQGAIAKTNMRMVKRGNEISLNLSGAEGEYFGMADSRKYSLVAYTGSEVGAVKLNGKDVVFSFKAGKLFVDFGELSQTVDKEIKIFLK